MEAKIRKNIIFTCVLLFAFALRVLIASYALGYRENTDILRYRDWARIAYLYGLRDTYSTDHLTFGTLPNNQPPGSLYILYASYRTHILFTKAVLRLFPHTDTLYAWINGWSTNFMFRLGAMIADCLVALFIWIFIRKKRTTRWSDIIIIGTTLLNPVMLFNSSFMGQMDAWNNLFFIAALFLMMQKRYAYSVICFALSFLTKMSLIFVLPLFFYILFTQIGINKRLFWYAILFCITIITATLPVSNNPVAWYVHYLAVNATGEMSNITAFAFNFWWAVFHPIITIGDPSNLFTFSEIRLLNSPDVSSSFFGLPLFVWAYSIFILLLIPIIVLCVKKGKRLTEPKIIFTVFAITTLVAYMVLPKMHDRYMYPAILLFGIATVFNRKMWVSWIGLSLLNLCNLYIVWHPIRFAIVPYTLMNNSTFQWSISVATVLMASYSYWISYKMLKMS